ncbi:MAG: septum formation protein [Flammeovirgaceae bacterium]|jgi:septum formation protein
MFPLSKKLILASKSPRRQQLLADLGFEFEVRLKEVDEIFPDHIPLQEVAEYLAKLKADAFSPTLKADECCITADTVVLSENRILGKAWDVNEATEMLESLSGKAHEVITGVCLVTPTETHSFSVSTKVHFRGLEATEIAYYIEQFKPFDKAGAYGIQEWIGMIGIESIEGSYFNVVGLPTERLFRELKRFEKA